MAARFTAEQKGKKQMSEQPRSNVRRIKAPTLDNEALIKDNALTLIGRLTNPREQRISALIPALLRRWNLQGRVIGSDLGNNCFQFRFEREDDLRRFWTTDLTISLTGWSFSSDGNLSFRLLSPA